MLNFSLVFNCTNFTNFQPFAKIKYFNKKSFDVTRQFSRFKYKSVDGQYPRAKLPNWQGTLSPRRYLRSRHCFADSCKLENVMVRVR